uniref:Uncharacterized protein n=1 Tax=Leersia perrieri TaxID=77586 RepID=A0A0D9XWH6_9ORYZ
MKMKALHSMLLAIFLLQILLTEAAASASPTTSLLHDGNNNNGVASSRIRSSRRLLLEKQPRAAMDTNTFRVNGVHQTAPANGKPNVEFDASKKPKPGSGYNPRQN